MRSAEQCVRTAAGMYGVAAGWRNWEWGLTGNAATDVRRSVAHNDNPRRKKKWLTHQSHVTGKAGIVHLPEPTSMSGNECHVIVQHPATGN